QFFAKEFQAGREPEWNPYQFAGAPCMVARFSPFAFQFRILSPIVLAWVQLLSAIIAGVGMYAFCRRVLQVSSWPALFVSWCYPLTGFFVLWQGYQTSKPVCWLPWVFLGLDELLRRRKLLAGPFLSILTCFVFTSGNPDVAGQVLLAGAAYGCW